MMIRVVTVRGFENDNIVPSMLSLEDRIVFLVRKNNQHEEMYFDKLVKYNVLSNEFDEWFFTKPVGVASNHDSGNHFMYYASTEWDHNEVRIEFYNLDCDTFTNTFICSIKLEDKSGSHLGNSNIAHTELYGIDERYCIVALPKMSDDSNASSFLKYSYWTVSKRDFIRYRIWWGIMICFPGLTNCIYKNVTENPIFI